MKKVHVLALVVAAVLCAGVVGGGVFYVALSHTESHEVYGVARQWEKLISDCTFFDPQRRQGFDDAKYIRGLRAIDINGCPRNLRLSWVEYIHTLERSQSPAETLRGAVFTGFGFVEGATTGNFSTAKKQFERVDIVGAQQRLEKWFAYYGGW